VSRRLHRLMDAMAGGTFCTVCDERNPDPEGLCQGPKPIEEEEFWAGLRVPVEVDRQHETAAGSSKCIWCEEEVTEAGPCVERTRWQQEYSTRTTTTRASTSVKSTPVQYERCFHSHPPLPLGDGLVIYGGSCGSPAVKDADVYVGFDRIMAWSGRQFPWRQGEEFLIEVTDAAAPSALRAEDWKYAVTWVAQQVKLGRKVHVGCIGGHGRTGMFLAALVAEMAVDPDPIAYVRKHYCQKAVETREQVRFLEKQYGCPTAKPSKSHTPKSPSYTGWKDVVDDPEKIPGVREVRPGGKKGKGKNGKGGERQRILFRSEQERMGKTYVTPDYGRSGAVIGPLPEKGSS